MTSFAYAPAPAHTIWGAPSASDEVLPGIWKVSTSSHGGLVLSQERQQAMPEALRVEGGQYEEDIHWSMVALAFEAEFISSGRPGAASLMRLAHDTLRNWHPDRYAMFTERPVPRRESYVQRRREAYQAAVGQLVVISASGSWADWVPDGKVGVVGRTLTSVDHLGQPRFDGDPVRALVDEVRYDSGQLVNTFEAISAERLA